jgi:hypothetical protein
MSLGCATSKVAMRYMGHETPTMFLQYAQTLSTVAESEFLRFKKVTADGREYERDPAEMFEALALDKRTDRVLPNGYCTLPPRQACDKGNVWPRGRHEEIEALEGILLAIDGVRQADGSLTPLRGAGTPQNRLSQPDPGQEGRTETAK